MAKDLNHDIAVSGSSYEGSDRAKGAVKAASQGQMHTPMVGEGPKPTVTQSDETNKTASTNDNLTRTKQTVLSPMAKPAAGATPPTNVDAMQRPGQGATKPKQGRF